MTCRPRAGPCASVAAGLLLICASTGCAGWADDASEPRPKLCSSRDLGEPCASARVGVDYPIAIWSHCGVEQMYFGGRYWVIDPPQPEGRNELHGLARLLAESELHFTSEDDRRYRFKPAPRSYSPPPCF
jgi:hypothetical protein